MKSALKLRFKLLLHLSDYTDLFGTKKLILSVKKLLTMTQSYFEANGKLYKNVREELEDLFNAYRWQY